MPCLISARLLIDLQEVSLLVTITRFNFVHLGIWKRDSMVIDSCMRANVPTACVIGGGYDKDPRALARRHAILHRVAAAAWERRRHQ